MKLDQALDGGVGRVEAETEKGTVEVEVTDVDRLGVRVRGVTVKRGAPVDIVEEAARLPDALRALPERVEPVEVAKALGGAKLRTSLRDLRGREYFEVDVEAGKTSVRRTRVVDGEREAREWTMTREQLERLVKEIEG